MNYYCIPKDEFEWRDILLKCGGTKDDAWMYPYSQNKRVWTNHGLSYPMNDKVNGDEHIRIRCEDFLAKFSKECDAKLQEQLRESSQSTLLCRVSLLEQKVNHQDVVNVKAVEHHAKVEEDIHSLKVKSALFDDILKRLTKLESNSFSPGAIQDLVQMSDTRRRLDKLEGRFVAIDSDSAVLNDPDFMEHSFVGITIFGVPGNFEISSTGSGNDRCSVIFDPKASPKNVSFSIALEYMKHGRRARPAILPSRDSIGIVGGEMVWESGYRVYTAMMCKFVLSNDWEVLPE